MDVLCDGLSSSCCRVSKVVHLYIQNHQDTPVQSTLLDVLNEGDKSTKQ